MHRYNGEHHADPGEITPELHDVIDDITQSQMEEMLCSLPSRCFVMWVSKAGRYKTRLRVWGEIGVDFYVRPALP